MLVRDLRIRGLVKYFQGRERVVAVDHVDVDVKGGEFLVLLGPSGCGKTTLLRCVAGLEVAQEGTIVLDGNTVYDAVTHFNLPTHKRDIGMVFQNYSLWPHMTVGKNVEYPLLARGVGAPERAQRAKEVLDIVQCGHLGERIPSMLSGGQQQRIALARALASRPAVMLLDEPLSNLDALLRVDLRAQLRAVHRALGFTAIYVTHDQTEAFNLGTRVAVMRSGRIEQLGSAADVYGSPISDYVAKFLGIRNMLALFYDGGWHSSAGNVEGLELQQGLQSGATKSSPLQLFVRPEHLRLAIGRNELQGQGVLKLQRARVVDALYSGGEIDYVIEINGVTLYAKFTEPEVRFSPGDWVQPWLKRENALFYANGNLVKSAFQGSGTLT
jgi:iron(III) transport system ATP-binding protein